MVTLPPEITYAELYFTLRCNLKCSYCINGLTTFQRKRQELSVVELSEGLNRIDFDGLPLTIGGGEPTLREDFYDLLDSLNPDTNIDLLSNLQFNVDEFINKVDPLRFVRARKPAYKSIRVSYHPSQMVASKLVQKVAKLQEAGFQVGVFGISHPLNITANIEMAEIARKEKVYFFIKDYLGLYNNHLFGFYKYPEGLSGKDKSCFCRINELLIGPDGNLYKCHRDLYNLEFAYNSILTEKLQLEYRFRSCDKYGSCNPCDLKLKANRFFDAGYCSVEIKNI